MPGDSSDGVGVLAKATCQKALGVDRLRPPLIARSHPGIIVTVSSTL